MINRRGRTSIVLTVTVALLVLAIGYAGFVSWARHNRVFPTSVDLVTISGITGVKFPASARVIGSRMGIFSTAEIHAKIIINRSDVKRFQSQFPAGPYSSPKHVLTLLRRVSGPSVGEWWNPWSVERPLAFVGCEGRVFGIIDVSGSRQAAIYFHKLAK